jgi:hypothetical protein
MIQARVQFLFDLDFFWLMVTKVVNASQTQVGIFIVAGID